MPLTHDPIKLLLPLPVMLVDLTYWQSEVAPLLHSHLSMAKLLQNGDLFPIGMPASFNRNTYLRDATWLICSNLRIFNRLFLNIFYFGIYYTTAMTQ